MMIRDSAKRKARDEEQRFTDALKTQVDAANRDEVARAAGLQRATLDSLMLQQSWRLPVCAQVAEGLGHESLEDALGGGET